MDCVIYGVLNDRDNKRYNREKWMALMSIYLKSLLKCDRNKASFYIKERIHLTIGYTLDSERIIQSFKLRSLI
jgi:hypothetical protein